MGMTRSVRRQRRPGGGTELTGQRVAIILASKVWVAAKGALPVESYRNG